MPKLVDSQEVEIPNEGRWNAYFRAELNIDYGDEDENYAPNQVSIDIHMPEYMGCITLQNDGFQYASYGYLSASLDETVDEFISNYDLYYDSLDEARFLRNSLQNLVGKLDAFIATKEGEK